MAVEKATAAGSTPLAPVAPRASANQEEPVRTNAATNGNRTSSAKAHARNLAKLQMHLPREVVFRPASARVSLARQPQWLARH